jgi:alpha-L-fucosidase
VTWGRITLKESKKGTTLYLSVFDWPKNGKLVVPGLTNEILSAKLLANGEPVKAKWEEEGLVIRVPEKALDTIATVIKLEVKGTVADQKTVSKNN